MSGLCLCWSFIFFSPTHGRSFSHQRYKDRTFPDGRIILKNGRNKVVVSRVLYCQIPPNHHTGASSSPEFLLPMYHLARNQLESATPKRLIPKRLMFATPKDTVSSMVLFDIS
ncbi:uncharacterized protein C8R40DRAFT_1134493 [Lentinula edodes]|uniref:uncharacterized protein n=1 Tax=Lentinula edodes TaxID=5353 RepID=UPI001E8ED3CD|nr:uncharacterized protein C8R40DRAFT_1134493 [Lentinula edodes]KAH7868583.1 hypothetical protein C8R40DRAFT_1134493 [Lentinula edodes]